MLKICILLQIISTISGLYLLPKDDNFTSFETIYNPYDIKDRLLIKHLIVVDADTPEPYLFDGSIETIPLIIYTIIALIWIAAAAIGFFFYFRSLTCKLSTKPSQSNVEPSRDGYEANRKSIVG